MAKEEGGERNYSLDPLVKVMERLRSETGCPWDREQNHESLKPYLIEETYEVIEAIEQKNMYSLREELGDLLLQIVFHTELASEQGIFDINDVVAGIVAKMKHRHPHVFEKKEAISTEEVLDNWEEIKEQEKNRAGNEKTLLDVPRALPALLRARKIQSKAAKIGFDWPNITGAWSKIEEEYQELLEAIKEEDGKAIKDELGDLLFAIVNVARFLEVDPEEALGQTCDKFTGRFDLMESRAKTLGLELKDLTLDEMDELWEEIKGKKY